MRVSHASAVVYLCLALFAGMAFSESDSQGATVFRARCGACHGEDGSGKGRKNLKMKVPDLRAKQVQNLSDKELYETIAYGKKHREYPHAYLYTGLTKQQIESVVGFIRTLKE